MNILIDINHPAHVHFFKNAIDLFQKKGHKIFVVARDKDVTLPLLQYYRIPYVVGSNRKSGFFQLGLELFEHTMKLMKASRTFHPDVIISFASPMASWAAVLLGIPSIAFDDTEHAKIGAALYQPFASAICTPTSFWRDLGKKQYRFKGCKALAYLHPKWFTPDPSILKTLGMEVGETFSFVRFVSWQAAHDAGQKGFSRLEKEALVEKMLGFGKVILSVENQKEPTLVGSNLSIPLFQVHNLLSYASLYFGEGGAMAIEAAVLGTPSIYVNTLSAGIIDELENKYHLLMSFKNGAPAIIKAQEILSDPGSKALWEERRNNMLKEVDDVTTWMVDFVENYRVV